MPAELPEIVCILQHAGIGNLVHLTPMITAIRQVKPGARIYLMTRPHTSQILNGWPMLDMIVTTNPYEAMKDLGVPITCLIISPAGAYIYPGMEKLCQHILQQRIEEQWTRHEVDVHMDFARELGYLGATPPSTVVVLDHHRAVADELLRKHQIEAGNFVAVNASYLQKEHWPLKHWGNDKYHRLAHWLREEQGLLPVFVGARSDWQNAQEITENNSIGINLCGVSEDIRDTAALLAQAKLLIGNDGGLAHIASALGVPTLTIFTFTNPIKNTPRGGATVMVPCELRPRCQHGLYDRCAARGCLDVPFEWVRDAAQEALTKADKKGPFPNNDIP